VRDLAGQPRSGKDRECADVLRTDDCEVSMVEGGDRVDAESLSEGDDRRIHEPEAKVDLSLQ
jgi:hypothetical protein